MYPRSAALLAAAYVALAVLFATGAVRGIDQWAVDHLMPGGDFTAAEPSTLNALVPFRHVDWADGWDVAVNVVTLPASFLVALAVAAFVSRRLALVLVAAVAVEVVCKRLLDGTPLYDGTLHIVAFDSSFPSGHTLRVVILAGALALLRPRLRPVAIAWAAAAIALLVLAGWHTPADVAGGVVLGLLALLAWVAGGGLRGRRA